MISGAVALYPETIKSISSDWYAEGYSLGLTERMGHARSVSAKSHQDLADSFASRERLLPQNAAIKSS